MNILFLCVGNSGRSQIAEGFAKNMLPKNFDIRSAGSNPANNVHEDAIYVMNEIGIDISLNKPKSIASLDKKFINNLEFVITLCSEEVCPIVPRSTKKLHWPIEDPDNSNISSRQSRSLFLVTRTNVYNLLKKFLLTEKLV